MRARLREIVAAHTGIDIDRLGDSADLWQAGMTSKNAVRVMLDVEDELGIEFPPEGLSHDSFATVDAIARTIHRAAAAPEGVRQA
jgi:acyl carrier protein